jgi:polysaccharide export outer membrane protein
VKHQRSLVVTIEDNECEWEVVMMTRQIYKAAGTTFVTLVLMALLLNFASMAAAQQAAQEWDGYRIGPEDVLNVSVWKNEDISRIVPVRPDGKISLPLLNDIQAAGLTPLQLRDKIREDLRQYEPAVEVAVILMEVRSYKVSVLGEVVHPGRFELRRWSTVLDAIALAGGFKDFAATSRIVIVRSDGKTTTKIPFDYRKAIAKGGEAETLFLQPGDIVVVP